MDKLTKLFTLFKNGLKSLLRSKKNRQKFIGALVILLILAGGIVYLKKENRVFIDDSLIQAQVINISPSTPGILKEVDVTEGQTVNKGDQLAVVGTEVLRAQEGGLIVGTDKQIGSYLAPSMSAVEIVHPQDFRVVGTLDENKGLKDVRAGQVASFTVDAFPGQTFWGYVDEVSLTANQTNAAFSISSERPTQQFDVYVRFDTEKYSQLKNGMSAKLTVYTGTN